MILSKTRASRHPPSLLKIRLYWRIPLCIYVWIFEESTSAFALKVDKSLGTFTWLCSIATFPMDDLQLARIKVIHLKLATYELCIEVG